MKNLSIIIPTYNNQKGVDYLLNYFKNKPYQIIIVDNNPKIKKLKKWQKKEFKNLIYLPQNKNLGFAKGVNIGAKYVKSDLMIILNDDIEFIPQDLKIKIQNLKLKIKKEKFFEDLLDYKEKKGFDAVSPVLINSNGEIENLGYRLLPYGKIELVKELTESTFDKNVDLDGISAACLLIKTKIFKDLGGFDENFFAYLEDVEFFIRFKKKGYQFGIAPFAVLHHKLTTSKTMKSLKAKQDLLNWWRLYFKHPEKFIFDGKFIIERLRNFVGYIKSKFFVYKF